MSQSRFSRSRDPFQKKIAHLDLIEGVVVDLLKVKWKTFIKREFFKQMFSFTIFFFISCFVYIGRPWEPEFSCVDIEEAANMTNSSELLTTTLSLFPDVEYTTTLASILTDYDVTSGLNTTISGAGNGTTASPEEEDEEECPEGTVYQARDNCYHNTYDTTLKQCRLVAEIILVFWSIAYIVIAIKEWSFLGTKLFKENLSLCPSRVMFLLGCVLLLVSIPFRLSCQPVIEDHLASLVMLFTGFYFLFFCRGFKKTGPFVTMIYRMAANDLLRFVIIYIIFVMGFSQCKISSRIPSRNSIL